MQRRIDADEWVSFYRDGYLKLGRTLDDNELEGLRTRIDEIMLGRVDTSRLDMQLDPGGEYRMLPTERGCRRPTVRYRKIQGLENDPRFRTFMRKPLFRTLCERIYGAHIDITLFRAMFMNKPAHGGTHLPWHQDAGAQWGLDRDPVATVWTALDPATRANGCVKVVPGTHHLGLLSKYGHVIDETLQERLCTPEKTVYLELKAGESVLLHNWLLHASEVNSTDAPRRAFSVCYLDGRTRKVPRQEGDETSFFKIFETRVPQAPRTTSVYA